MSRTISNLDSEARFVAEFRNPGDPNHGRFAAQFSDFDKALKFFNKGSNMGTHRRLYVVLKEEIDD